METAGTILILVWLATGPIFLFLWLRLRRRSAREIADAESSVAAAEARKAEVESRFEPVLSIEVEVQRLLSEVGDVQSQIDRLRAAYAEKRSVFQRLEEQIAIYDEKLSFAEMGVYEPHFDFTDSEAFKQAILDVRAEQKAMVSGKRATLCPTDWTVNGSLAQGRTMINRQARLSLRAFNNECEAAIANARWNNAKAMEKRIMNSASQIDKANESMKVRIARAYVELKLKELRLTHEYREKQKEEREERAEAARAEREEKRLLAEARQAEREEQKWRELLEKARQEVGSVEATETLRQKIEALETALAEAHERTERARAMAELTKSGYVYVISNVGSFGEDLVKIGLTRRLNPDDRVRELGDASVPFTFDTHAMIYSDQAPVLEAALHAEFADRRVNMSNMRKEFFRVDLDEVEKAVQRLAPDASFFKDREAQEWHETLARRSEQLQQVQAAAFPATI